MYEETVHRLKEARLSGGRYTECAYREKKEGVYLFLSCMTECILKFELMMVDNAGLTIQKEIQIDDTTDVREAMYRIADEYNEVGDLLVDLTFLLI